MTNPSDEPAAAGTRDPDLSEQIERSLGSIWQRRTGVRPASISAEVRGDAVRCAIKPGEPGADDADDADEAEVEVEVEGASDAYSFRHESIAAVTKIMHRPISAFIDAEGATKGTSQQTFIFERSQTRY
jgi:hypothetical protein